VTDHAEGTCAGCGGPAPLEAVIVEGEQFIFQRDRCDFCLVDEYNRATAALDRARDAWNGRTAGTEEHER
jgi:hypothetical protein